MSKKLHVNCYQVADKDAEALRQLVCEYNEPATYEEWQNEGFPRVEPAVEILYEESSRGRTGFDLWFATPATAFYFGVAWGTRRVELAAPAPPAEAPYPRFLYSARMGYFCRQNAPGQFCLVGKTHLQVRREAPQDLFDAGDWQASDEALFLAAFAQQRVALLDYARQYVTTYQRRGAPGNEWFYANPIVAATTAMPMHLRLNASDNAHGRCWQLMWAHDTRRLDPRRVASDEAAFTRQLEAMLADAEAMATGEQEGGVTSA